MADCHNYFQVFDGKITLLSTKKTKMSKSKDELRDLIRDYFKEHHPEYIPKFYIQGSYKMGSCIRTKEEICDLDDGVYFFRQPDVSSSTLQGWIWDAVNGHTDTAPIHKQKCIRVIFSAGYEIDIPVYFKTDDKDYQLLLKDGGERSDDPKAMVDWFASQKDKEGKLIRIVRYLKAWCDNVKNYMPSGLAMTILASNAKVRIDYTQDRDDILLKDTLVEIKKVLGASFQCFVPVTPKDNLFEKYDADRQRKVLECLDAFIADAEEALKETNELKATKLWSKHLGNRFPEGKDQKVEDKRNDGLAAKIGAGVSPWGGS